MIIVSKKLFIKMPLCWFFALMFMILSLLSIQVYADPNDLNFSTWHGVKTDESLWIQVHTQEKQDETNNIPESLDWRAMKGNNWMTPVRSQDFCGSCVAMGVTSVLEAQIKINTGFFWWDPILSVQALFACGGGECERGMHLQTAIYYLKNQGVPDETCLPYKAMSGSKACQLCPDSKSRSFFLSEVNPITKGIVDHIKIKQALQSGPVWALMAAYSDLSMHSYGVYRHNPVEGEKTPNGHTVAIIGYNDKKKSWLIKNSWSEYWGEKGYASIYYHDRLSALGSESYQLILKGQKYLTIKDLSHLELILKPTEIRAQLYWDSFNNKEKEMDQSITIELQNKNSSGDWKRINQCQWNKNNDTTLAPQVVNCSMTLNPSLLLSPERNELRLYALNKTVGPFKEPLYSWPITVLKPKIINVENLLSQQAGKDGGYHWEKQLHEDWKNHWQEAWNNSAQTSRLKSLSQIKTAAKTHASTSIQYQLHSVPPTHKITIQVYKDNFEKPFAVRVVEDPPETFFIEFNTYVLTNGKYKIILEAHYSFKSQTLNWKGHLGMFTINSN